MSENHETVWWTELATRDVEAAKNCHATVCGWTYDEAPMDGGTYNAAKIADRMIAGLLDMATVPGMERLSPHWSTYLAVDDVDQAVEQTRSSGGQVFREPWDIPGVGRIAIIDTPSGAAVGIMTPSERPV